MSNILSLAERIGILENQLIDAAHTIAALEAQLAERKWRPIESAPKDKLILISLRRKHGTRVTVRACWYGENELENPDYIETEYAPSGWYESSAESEHCDALNGEPTHWMPLPQPPKETPK